MYDGMIMLLNGIIYHANLENIDRDFQREDGEIVHDYVVKDYYLFIELKSQRFFSSILWIQDF